MSGSTETFGDISKVLFERCKVNASGRGPTVTHRQQGNIEDIEFRDIEVTAEHHAARWGSNIQQYFSNALEAENVIGLKIEGLHGQAAHPATQKRLLIH